MPDIDAVSAMSGKRVKHMPFSVFSARSVRDEKLINIFEPITHNSELPNRLFNRIGVSHMVPQE